MLNALSIILQYPIALLRLLSAFGFLAARPSLGETSVFVCLSLSDNKVSGIAQ